MADRGEHIRNPGEKPVNRIFKKQAFLKRLDERSRRYYLSADITTIGSKSSVLYLLDDPSVDGLHATIVQKKDEFILFDVDEARGTYVNGVQVAECSLRDGDVLRFGKISVGFFYRSSSRHGGF